jgi:signal transduction histidine kinase
VVVRDTGIGIAPQDLPHVFERFYRADPARRRDPGGTGLGLAIARWIAEQHGGTLALASEAGRGTTATVRLPEGEGDPPGRASA